MVDIPTIEPFQFIRSTAFSERVQLANKINEIIEGINSIGEIPDIQAEIDAVKGTISQIQTELEDTNSDVSGLTNQVNTLISEVNGLLKEVISEVSLDSPGYGQVRVKMIHEDETETASNVLQIPVIQDGGITLISGTTDRSFKIQYITMDGVTHTTNDFVIPEGGGTDVTITSISILQGDTPNDIKFQVGLSDGSSIQSNSYPIPQTAITPATTSQIGGIKVGTNLSVTADGTLSVDMTTIGTAAVASTMMFTADASKVTLHGDSIAGSEFTKDIPQASQGGAGTIDQASYAKIAANESAISELEADVAALAPSVSVNEAVDPPTITVAINGKSSTANLPAGGGDEWEEIDLSSIPLDFSANERIKVVFKPLKASLSKTPSSWTSAISAVADLTTEDSSPLYDITMEFTIPPEFDVDASNNRGIPLMMGNNFNRTYAMIAFVYVMPVTSWNAQNNSMFTIEGSFFNGASAERFDENMTRQRIPNFVKAMYRIRP